MQKPCQFESMTTRDLEKADKWMETYCVSKLYMQMHAVRWGGHVGLPHMWKVKWIYIEDRFTLPFYVQRNRHTLNTYLLVWILNKRSSAASTIRCNFIKRDKYFKHPQKNKKLCYTTDFRVVLSQHRCSMAKLSYSWLELLLPMNVLQLVAGVWVWTYTRAFQSEGELLKQLNFSTVKCGQWPPQQSSLWIPQRKESFTLRIFHVFHSIYHWNKFTIFFLHF